MASIVVNGDTSGAVTLSAPATAGTVTVTLPATSGTMLTTASSTGVSGSAISSGTVAEAYGGTGTNTGYYGFKNRIINGACVIDQRNAGAAVTINASGNVFTVDRWVVENSTTGGVVTAQQSSTAPAGFNYSLKTTVTTTGTLASDRYLEYQYRIEGYNLADLNWGSANARTITVSFWVQSSVTGIFGGAISNGAFNRSYSFLFTISSANTWEQKTVTIAGDTTGTWVTTNGLSAYLFINMGAGSAVGTTPNQWNASGSRAAIGENASIIGTNGATFYITGVQLEKGSTATSFDYRPYGTELALCQRYFQKLQDYYFSTYNTASEPSGYSNNFNTEMRASPTLAYASSGGTNFNGLTVDSVTQYGYRAYALNTGNGRMFLSISGITTSAEL